MPVVCLHHLFEVEADNHPERSAIVSGDLTLSYGELEGRANQLARHLRARGVATGDRVGLLVERSPDAVVAMLAILKAGAAYLPLDPSHPPDRQRHIVAEAGVAVLVSDSALAGAAALLGAATVVVVDTVTGGAAPQWTGCARERLRAEEVGLSASDLAYVLYTSGSTGRPKGVMTEHCNVVAFVHAFNKTLRAVGLSSADRVFQGFALTFDGSVEETWMALSNGATLIVPPRGSPRFGDDLARLITAAGATVFSTVPTSLSMMSEPLPTVHLLIVSGEPCSETLVARWATPARRLLNVYGPTETTVNATVAECRPGRPVSIGVPLPGYQVELLDEERRPVGPGQPGELYIAGPGVARGYLGQPELTARHFVDLPSRRAYRTGDLVSWRDGELHFHGRIDDQVKIRGFRVELAEIEAVLAEHPAIRTAVVTVVERQGARELAAYVVATAERGREVDHDSVLALLAARLPAYMVPASLDVLDELPTLPSGKVDRKRLPPPVSPLVRRGRARRPPRTPRERDVLAVVSRVFEHDVISTDDDFFLALGGYSLLAARLVSELRRALGLEVAIRDVYDHPSVEALAAHLDGREAARAAGAARPPRTGAPRAVSRATRRACAAAQAVALYFVHGAMGIPYLAGLIPFLIWRSDPTTGLARCLGAGVLLSAAVWPALIALSVAIKWIVIGRYRTGAYPLWGGYYFRFWLVRRFQQLAAPGVVAGTPLMSLYYRLMGARVGRGCTIDTPQCAAFDLVSIGDDSSIGAETQLLGYRVERGQLIIGPVDIGSRCFVGIHSALGLGACMGDDARLADLSLLPDGASIPSGQARRGSPAQPAAVPVPAAQNLADAQAAARHRPMLFGFLHLATLYGLGLALVPTALPSALLLSHVLAPGGGWLARLIGVPAAGVLALVAFCAWIPVLKLLLLPRARPGIHRVASGFFLRKWAVDLLMHASRVLARPLYTTIYLPTWLRLLGAKIGRHAEISTVSQIAPELIRIGEQSFFADGSMIGGRRIHRGLVEIAESQVGRRSFVGNSAILPVGSSLGDECLLGCLSAPPGEPTRTPDRSEWLGSPSFPLPHRKKVGGFDETVTHRPTRALVAQRLVIDALRLVIPPAIVAGQAAALAALLAWAWHRLGGPAALVLAPLAVMAASAAGLACVVATKRALIGTFRPTVKPLWSVFVWLNEVVNGAFESVAAPCLAPLLGTPYAAPWLRLLGCRIGRRVYLETTLFSEFDLVEVGDDAALNAGAVIQNHLFEDRIMKASSLKVGDGCSVGNMAVVLYDTEMQAGASIGPLSLLMKGEILPPHTRWLGIPTAPLAAPVPVPATAAAAVPAARSAGSDVSSPGGE
jgi:non-ribosomal peptide synthetase-like protein